MPMKVIPSHTGEVTAARTGHAASASASKASASFASVLASTSTAAPVPGTDVAPAAPAAPLAISLHKGEAMSAVNGHSYAEINGGKRDGLYVNTSNNKRRGQAFVLVHKHGREYHIYGTGKNRLVVALRKPDASDTQKTASTNTAAGTGGTTPTVSAS
jgi:hypothetical protein